MCIRDSSKVLATRAQAPTHDSAAQLSMDNGPALNEKALAFAGQMALSRGPSSWSPLRRLRRVGLSRIFSGAFSSRPLGPGDFARWASFSSRSRFGVGRRSCELRGGVLRPATAEDVWLSDRYRREVCPVRESGDLPTAIGARLVPHGAGSDRYRREVPSPHAQVRWLFVFKSFYASQ